MFKLDNVSIVITSIGGDDLIESLNMIYNDLDINSDFEIILTLPKKNYINFSIQKFKNLKVIHTYFSGQVNQRVIGFKNTNNKFVLQIDDDVLITSKDIFNLKSQITLMGENCSISPLFFDRNNKKECIYKLKNSNIIHLIKNLITFTICKSNWGIKRSGTLTTLGTNYGVDNSVFTKENIIEVDWLPGGCVMHYDKNLYKFDYFPFKGKAYCEDLIHSLILKNNNIRLYVYRDSICYTYTPLFPESRVEKYNFFRAYNYFYIKFKIFNFRYLIWCLINIIRIVK